MASYFIDSNDLRVIFFFFKLSFLINVKDTNVTHLLMGFLCDTGIPLPHMDVEVFDSFLHSYF